MNLLLAIVLLHYVWFFDCSLLQQTAHCSISDFQFHAKLCNLLALFRLMYYYFAYFISYFICYSYDLTVKYWGSISPLSVCIFILVQSHREITQAVQNTADLDNESKLNFLGIFSFVSSLPIDLSVGFQRML